MAARKKVIPRSEAEHHCRDCANSYDWQNRSFTPDHHFIFCKCKYHTGGRYCKFLSDVACEHFVKRTEEQKNGE